MERLLDISVWRGLRTGKSESKGSQPGFLIAGWGRAERGSQMGKTLVSETSVGLGFILPDSWPLGTLSSGISSDPHYTP